MKRILLILFVSISGLWSEKSNAQCDCGTGADGAFHATSNMTLIGGTYNYTTFMIDAGMTVTVTGSAPLIIKCTGKITIDGILDLSGSNGTDGITNVGPGIGGIAVAGGHNGADGVYFGGPTTGMVGSGPGGGGAGDIWGGGAGGGYGAVGGNGIPYQAGPVAPGGAMYGDIYLVTNDGGSGGGSGSGGFSCGSGGGGAGGGILVMRSCDTLTITGSGVIAANGGHGGSDGTGNCGGGGGGAGGSVWLIAPRMEHDGNIQAFGGLGGSSAVAADGGMGAIGRIRLQFDANPGSGNTSPSAGYTSQMLIGSMNAVGVSCNGDLDGSAIVTGIGGAPGYTYLWVGGTTDTDTANLAPGSYAVTITDTNGCTVNDTAVITEPAAITSTISSTDETTVSSTDGTATVTPSGGTAPYTYLWTPGGGTTNPLTGLDTGTYIVTITDDNGCTSNDTVHVDQGIPISVTTTLADHGLSIYPNPASDVVTIAFKDKVNGEIIIQLTDNVGRVIVSEKYTNTSVFQLNTNTYASGNYMLHISAEGSIKNIPLSIVR